MNRFVIGVLSVTSCLFLATATYAHDGATGIVKERMDAFSEARGQMKQIRGAIGGSEFDAITEISAKMQIWADKMGNYFPEGSDQPLRGSAYDLVGLRRLCYENICLSAIHPNLTCCCPIR